MCVFEVILRCRMKCCNVIMYRVCTEKSFQNSHTFHKPMLYGTEKQHEGMQLFHTSSKGVQPLL